MGPTLRYLVHDLDRQSMSLQVSRSAAGSDDVETELDQFLDRGHNIVLVGVLHRNERCAKLRQVHPGSEQCFCKCGVEIACNSHYFAGAFHFRSKHRVGTGKTGEWENGLLHGNIVAEA